ncbi:MAG TPA: MFS transporter [Solirubrobacterales bacterium]
MGARLIRAADLSVLRDGGLRRLVLAQFASTVGDLMVVAALPFAVFAIGGTIGQVGIALAVQGVVLAGFLLFGGVGGDRMARRSVVVVADLCRFTAQAGVAALLLTGNLELWQLLVAQAILGAGAAFFMPAMQGLISQAVRPDRLQQANALRGIAASAGSIAGPTIAIVVLAASGPGWAFAADALTFLISAALLARVHAPVAPASVGGRRCSIRSDLSAGWSAFRRTTWAWAIVTEFAVLNSLVFAPFFVFGPKVSVDSLGGAGAWAAILAAMGAGELLGGLVAMVWRPQRPLLVATLVVSLWAAPLLLLAAVAPVPLIAAGAAAAGASLAVFAALWETILQTRTPTPMRSRFSSYDLLGSFALIPLGYALGALEEELFGAGPGLIAAAAVIAVCTFAVLAVPSVRGMRSAPAPDSHSLAPEGY